MKKCKRCGNIIYDESKFCGKCGSPLDEESEELETEEMYDDFDDDYEDIEDIIKRRKRKKIVIGIIAAIIVLGLAIAGALEVLNMKALNAKSITVENVDSTSYPDIEVTIKTENFDQGLNKDKFTVKENDSYQKDVKLEDKENGEYKISYSTSDKSSSGERKVKIAYEDTDGKEIKLETSYDAPSENKNQNTKKSSNANNSVNTYDENEVNVKRAVDNYEQAYGRMVDHKDTTYIRSVIDLSGGLLSDFDSTVKSYKDQKIDENLKKHEIKSITKKDDSSYEVTVIENYHIYYGLKKESKDVDYSVKYLVKNTSSGFKVNNIEKIDVL